jgi:hypothetical protein
MPAGSEAWLKKGAMASTTTPLEADVEVDLEDVDSSSDAGYQAIKECDAQVLSNWRRNGDDGSEHHAAAAARSAELTLDKASVSCLQFAKIVVS